MNRQRDLVVLVADNNIGQAVHGILSRYQSLCIRKIEFDLYAHSLRDPGVFEEAHEFLRPYTNLYNHAIVLLDHEGSGQESASAEEMEAKIEDNLSRTGWKDRSAAIVIDPELEVWVWSDSPVVEKQLKWSSRYPGLRDWLVSKGFLRADATKPSRPKEAVEAVLREVRLPRSSSLYRALAERVSLAKCTDRAFEKLRSTLQRWFGISAGRTPVLA